MDPNPKNFPILSYVMTRIPSFGVKPTPSSTSDHTDIEQPPSPVSKHQLVDSMPRLTDPKIIASMTRAISEVVQTRSVLKAIGDRPDHEAVDDAKARVADIEANLSKQLEELVLSSRPADVDPPQWRANLAEKETEYRQLAEREKQPFKTIVQLDEMHVAYEKLLKEAEERLEKIYESAEYQGESQEDKGETVMEEVNEEVIRILQEGCGNGLERVDLSGRRLRILPEDFGRIRGLLVLNVSSNHIQVIPDSIAGLGNLEELNVSSNLLELLPDSIGLLQKLKMLNVSGNKLTALPDSICHCRSLVELDASFNALTYLPTNIGFELVNLEKLSIQLNKIRSLPSSVCEMKSLRYLDAHFNELRGLPLAIGKLTNLEVLILSSNFSDLAELPDTIGDLMNLRELDLSNNQIHALPDTFGRLNNLTKLNLDQNPIVVPPLEVINQGAEAVKDFMAKRWVEVLAEEEKKEQGATRTITGRMVDTQYFLVEGLCFRCFGNLISKKSTRHLSESTVLICYPEDIASCAHFWLLVYRMCIY